MPEDDGGSASTGSGTQDGDGVTEPRTQDGSEATESGTQTENGVTDGGTAGDGAGTDEVEQLPVEPTLARVRTTRRLQAVGFAVAITVGLAASTLHWVGLVFGGMVVGLVARTLPRALVAAAGFGLFVLGAFAFSLGGSIQPVVEMAPVTYLLIASAFGLPMLGALARGIV